MKKIVVVDGDLVWDHNLVEHPTAPNTYQEPFSNTVLHRRPGGAWYLAEMVDKACADLTRANPDLLQVVRPPREERPDPGTLPASDAFSLWAPYVQHPDGKKVWRIRNFLGCPRPGRAGSQGDGGEKTTSADQVLPDDVPPHVLVLDDLARGFNQLRPRWPKWIKTGEHPKSIVLKLTCMPSASPLFGELLKHEQYRDNLTVIISANLLRLRGAAISRGLSWDRTINETVREMQHGASSRDLGTCRRVIVTFDTAAAASFSRCWQEPLMKEVNGKKELVVDEDDNIEAQTVCREHAELERFLYHPDETEEAWRSQRPGDTFGIASILAAAMARHELDPASFPLFIALGRGLAAARANHEQGGGSADGDFDAQAGFQAIEEVFWGPPPKSDKANPQDNQEPRDEPAALYCTAFPHGLLENKDLNKQPADESNLLRDLTGPGLEYTYAKATEVVLAGPERALAAAPKARYGQYLTVDREEIERTNTLRRLVTGYLDNPDDKRPLSVAVFGPPGSGKSFAIKQLARELFGKKKEAMEFNLSQLDCKRIEDLYQAFHQVRDASIRGEIPLVFWDEFDADDFAWLKHFLAPMQDAKFLEHGNAHYFGRAIFVFAGGSCSTFEQFRDEVEKRKLDKPEMNRPKVKGSDFVSRLRGFVNIKGPNPTGGNPEEDPAYLIRRATLMRAMLNRHYPQLIEPTSKTALVSTTVIRAFLKADKFLHGARSMEAVLTTSSLAEAGHFGIAELPAEGLLGMHVTEDFYKDHLRDGEMEASLVEQIAEVIYEAWRQKKLRHIADEQHATLPHYQELSEEDKEKNRLPARVTRAKLHEAGYELRRCIGDETPDTDVYDQIKNQLCRIEHDVWMRDHLLRGYAWGPETQEPLRLHCDIAPYDAVPDDHKEYDCEIVEATLRFLGDKNRPVAYKLVAREPAAQAAVQ